MISTAFHQLKQRVSLECKRPYKARGIKVKRCEICQLKRDNCLCGKQPNQDCSIDFILLFHLDEIFKPTNTGRLIADCFPNNTYTFKHSRTEPDQKLLDLLNDPSRQCIVIFPVSDELERNVISEISADQTKKLTLIIIDGTWRQGRRMYNSSEYLAHLPVVKLDPDDKSLYATRKASEDSHLSTIESVALTLKISGEERYSETLFNYFEEFNQHYSAIRPKR
jgi:DTW domain-containing protein